MERNGHQYELGIQYAQEVQESGVPFGELLPNGKRALDPQKAMETRDAAGQLRNDPQQDEYMQRFLSHQYDFLDGYVSRWGLALPSQLETDEREP